MHVTENNILGVQRHLIYERSNVDAYYFYSFPYCTQFFVVEASLRVHAVIIVITWHVR